MEIVAASKFHPSSHMIFGSFAEKKSEVYYCFYLSSRKKCPKQLCLAR